MAYSTPNLVRQALVPTSDGSLPATPSHTAADLGDDQLADMVSEADALIDGYLAKWYAVPVAEPVHPIDYWSRNIAAYEATLTYRGSMDITDNDPVARRYKATLDALKAVAKGDLRLDLPSNSGTDSSAAGGAGSAINPYSGDLWQPSDFVTPVDDGQAQIPFWRSW